MISQHTMLFLSMVLAFMIMAPVAYGQSHSLDNSGSGVPELSVNPMHQPEVGAANDQDDNPAGNTLHGSIDVGGTSVVDILTPAPKGTRLTGFEAGDPTNPATGEIYCNGVNWVGDGSTYTGTCTERVAASNSNQCGYNESLPDPAFAIIESSLPSQCDEEPCVIGEGRSVVEVGDPRFSPECYSHSTAGSQGEPIAFECLSTKQYKEIYGNQDFDNVPPEVMGLPMNTIELLDGGNDFIIFNACDGQYYRVHLYDPVMAGMNRWDDTFIIPTRCDKFNDYRQAMIAHSSGNHGLEVDQACPPALVDFCPPSSPVDCSNTLHSSCNPENDYSTNASGINLVPPDPVCDYGGNNYALFSEYTTGVGESTQGCNCECNGSIPPWNPNAAQGSCTSICGPGAFSSGFRTAGDVEAAGYCGPDSRLVAATDLTGPNGTLSWQCEYLDPDTGNATGFTANCSTQMNDRDPGCSSQNYDNRWNVTAGPSTNPGATDSYLGERADCGGTSNGWTQLSSSSAPEPTLSTITNNSAFASTSSCSWNNDGVNMRRLIEDDERYCRVDRDPYSCSYASCDVSQTTETCSCTSPTTCTWTTTGLPYATSHDIYPGADIFTLGCGAVQAVPCPGCTSFPAVSGCTPGGSCTAGSDPCLLNQSTCEFSGNTATTWDMHACVCTGGSGTCTSSSSTTNYTSGGECPSTGSSSLACSSAPGHDGNTDTYVTSTSQNYGRSPSSPARSFDGSNVSTQNGNCPSVGNPPTCNSTGSGTFIDSTRQYYECQRDYRYYNCNCNEACGAADGGFFNDSSSITPATQCAGSSVNASPLTVSGSTVTWTCETADDVHNCSAIVDTTVINATCGGANGNTYSSISEVSAAGPCGAGTGVIGGVPSGITDTGSGFTWTCGGYGGGSNINCSANKTSTINGVCNSAAETGGPYNNFAEISNPCSSGTVSGENTSSTLITWDCLGSGPGHSDDLNCSADTIGGTVQCGTAHEGVYYIGAGRTTTGGSSSAQPLRGSDSYCAAGAMQNLTYNASSFEWTWQCVDGSSSVCCEAYEKEMSCSQNPGAAEAGCCVSNSGRSDTSSECSGTLGTGYYDSGGSIVALHSGWQSSSIDRAPHNCLGNGNYGTGNFAACENILMNMDHDSGACCFSDNNECYIGTSHEAHDADADGAATQLCYVNVLGGPNGTCTRYSQNTNEGFSGDRRTGSGSCMTGCSTGGGPPSPPSGGACNRIFAPSGPLGSSDIAICVSNGSSITPADSCCPDSDLVAFPPPATSTFSCTGNHSSCP